MNQFTLLHQIGSYTHNTSCRGIATVTSQPEELMKNNNKYRAADVPLSEATIPTKLADIRQKCSDLLTAEGDIALCLEDGDGRQPALGNGAYNPYNRSS